MGTRLWTHLVQICLDWIVLLLVVAYPAHYVYHDEEGLLLSHHPHYQKARHRYQS